MSAGSMGIVPSWIGDVPVESTGSYFNGDEVLVVLVSPVVPLLLLVAVALVECWECVSVSPCVSAVTDGTNVGSSSGFGASGAKLTDLPAGDLVAEAFPSVEAASGPVPIFVRSTGTAVTSTGALLPVAGVVAVVLLGAPIEAVEFAFTAEGSPPCTLVEFTPVTSLSGLGILSPSGFMIGVVLGDLMRIFLCGVASCGGDCIRDVSKFEGAISES